MLTLPLRWLEFYSNRAKDVFVDFIELGPGKVLTGLGKRINLEVSCKAIGTVENINSL